MSLSNDRIVSLLNKMDKDTKALKEEALRISWYMRGGVSYDAAMMLSFQERDIIGKLIKNNLETTKKTGLNFF